MCMKTIVISNLKGGVGKTTTTVNLAFSLATPRYKVLVVDLDPQANTTSFFAKVNQSGKTIKDVIVHPPGIRQAIYRSKYKNIDIIKGCTDLQESNVTNSMYLVATLAQVKDEYDYCLIDTRPAFERLTMSAIVAADLMLTPAYLDKFCRDNLALVDEELSSIRPNLAPVWKVFATMVDTGRRAQKRIYLDLVTKHEYPFLETCVGRSADVENALDLYKPIYKHRSKSTVAADYFDLAEELVSVLDKIDHPLSDRKWKAERFQGLANKMEEVE